MSQEEGLCEMSRQSVLVEFISNGFCGWAERGGDIEGGEKEKEEPEADCEYYRQKLCKLNLTVMGFNPQGTLRHQAQGPAFPTPMNLSRTSPPSPPSPRPTPT